MRGTYIPRPETSPRKTSSRSKTARRRSARLCAIYRRVPALWVPLTVSSLVSPGQVDGPCGNLVIPRGDEPALPGVDHLVRLSRVGGSLTAVSTTGREKRTRVAIQIAILGRRE